MQPAKMISRQLSANKSFAAETLLNKYLCYLLPSYQLVPIQQYRVFKCVTVIQLVLLYFTRS